MTVVNKAEKHKELAGRVIPDYRPTQHDEYEHGDPYPKDDARVEAIRAYVKDALLPILPELCERDCTVLDAGCGTGDWLAEIVRQARMPAAVHVAEYSPTALEECLRRNPFIAEAILFDANEYPYNPNSFDVVISINMFEHIAAPVLFLRKAIASLKEHGVVIISTPSRYRFGNIIRNVFGMRGTLIHDLHVTEYTVGQVKEMAAFAGGRVTAVRGAAMVVRGQRMYWLSWLLAFPLQALLRMLGSHHLLHKTVFYRIERR